MDRPFARLRSMTARCMALLAALQIGALCWWQPQALSHGFTADVVDIKRLPDGKYRVLISYTHTQIGEYREAHIDFKEKAKAVAAFEKLARGAEFFRGSADTIHFHDTPQGKTQY